MQRTSGRACRTRGCRRHAHGLARETLNTLQIIIISAAHLSVGLQGAQVRQEPRGHAHGPALDQQVEHAQRARGRPQVRLVAGASGCHRCGDMRCSAAQMGQLLGIGVLGIRALTLNLVWHRKGRGEAPSLMCRAFHAVAPYAAPPSCFARMVVTDSSGNPTGQWQVSPQGHHDEATPCKESLPEKNTGVLSGPIMCAPCGPRHPADR